MKAQLFLLLAVACHGPPPALPDRCVPDWPAPSVTPLAAPLAAPLVGITPAVKWRRRLTRAVPLDPIVLTGGRLAVAASSRLFLLDAETGTVVGGRSSTGFERITAPVVAPDGHLHFAGSSAYSVDLDGNLRHVVPLAPSGPSAGKRMLLAPSGTLYTTASDGFLYAIDSATGAARWRVEVGKNVAAAAALPGGVGGAVHVITRGEAPSSRLYDATTGLRLATLATPDGVPRYGALFGATIGIVTQRPDDAPGPYPRMQIDVLDPCAKLRFTIPATRAQWPALLAPGDRLLVVERDATEGSPTEVAVYSPEGERVLAPRPAAPPWAVGADGTIYGLECDGAGVESPSSLIAYSDMLEERWRIELGPACPITTPVIGQDGTLYFAWFVDGVSEIVAVATPSPGLAGGWPARHHDARGTGWLE